MTKVASILVLVGLTGVLACKKEPAPEANESKSESAAKKSKKGDDEAKDNESDSKKKKDDGDEKKPKKAGKACPDKFNAFADHDTADEQSCTCEADHAGGALWGDGIYTEDSNPCAAAVHAGVIKADKGGAIVMKHAKGCNSYPGLKKNGVVSHGWGKFDGSFYFPDHGDGKCAKSDACPRTFKELPELDDETEVTCKCEPNPTGTVWGAHPYTQDSGLCAAAVHAGVITKDEGGFVTAKASPGCAKYEGNKQNGVKTSSWGPYDTSFFFPSKGDGVCQAEKKVTDAKWKVGEAVDVNWNGAWYQANVVSLAPGKYRVHYVGYANSWDEWVPASRIRPRTAGALKGSN